MTSDEQLDENTEDASWTACKGNHSAVCEQGSSGGAKSEASSLNASSSMSDARSVGVTGNGSTLRASGALQQKPTEPDEVSSAAAGQPQVQPASHTPVPADGSRNRRGRNGMSRSVSPGAHGSSEGEHQAGVNISSTIHNIHYLILTMPLSQAPLVHYIWYFRDTRHTFLVS